MSETKPDGIAVQALNLTKVFKRGQVSVTALEGVNLTVHAGQFDRA